MSDQVNAKFIIDANSEDPVGDDFFTGFEVETMISFARGKYTLKVFSVSGAELMSSGDKMIPFRDLTQEQQDAATERALEFVEDNKELIFNKYKE
jgi:hypothetical protein